MSKSEFESFLATLEKEGIPVKKAVYDDRTFGSWHITIEDPPDVRIVYDGRDRIKYLDRYDGKEWRDVLFDKTGSGRHIISKLKQEITGK